MTKPAKATAPPETARPDVARPDVARPEEAPGAPKVRAYASAAARAPSRSPTTSRRAISPSRQLESATRPSA